MDRALGYEPRTVGSSSLSIRTKYMARVPEWPKGSAGKSDALNGILGR